MESNKKQYFYFGFLDFLAYYVPGVFVLLFLIALNFVLKPGLLDINYSIEKLSEEPYIRGVTWTVLGLIIPYFLGHLIFPLSYGFGKIFFKNKLPEDKEVIERNCKGSDGNHYCVMESFQFAECLNKCLTNSSPGFNDFMITRFRTLSRFCRAMLFPVVLLTLSFIILGIYFIAGENPGGGIYLIGIGMIIISSFFGFGGRYKNYEMRWRNAVCIGKNIKSHK